MSRRGGGRERRRKNTRERRWKTQVYSRQGRRERTKREEEERGGRDLYKDPPSVHARDTVGVCVKERIEQAITTDDEMST